VTRAYHQTVHRRLTRDLVASIESWKATDPKARFEQLAWRGLAARPDLLKRNGVPAHFTASALPLSSDGRSVCLVLHLRMGLWVQPGGHLEPGDSSIAGAASRELQEETGLVGELDPVPLLLSRHRSPCGVGDWHLDLQFLARVADGHLTLSDESTDVAWFPVDDLPEATAPGVATLVGAALDRRREGGAPATPDSES
jgi:8-oxo-dGTP pyrophosphatase MutT (NUDIX family)